MGFVSEIWLGVEFYFIAGPLEWEHMNRHVL